jgi:predicted TIM-barrel fold metal-dependent hydrolase
MRDQWFESIFLQRRVERTPVRDYGSRTNRHPVIQYRIEPRRVFCRRLADYCSPYPDRLFGVAMLPMQSVPHAIEEMRFAKKELGFKGAFLRP